MIRTPIGKIYGDILMAKCGLHDRFAHKGKKVIVDGVVYPSVKAAVRSIDGKYSSFRLALERGWAVYKGHDIQYCEE